MKIDLEMTHGGYETTKLINNIIETYTTDPILYKTVIINGKDVDNIDILTIRIKRK